MCFGISDRPTDALALAPPRPRYQRPKEFRGSVMVPRNINDQAARLVRREKEECLEDESGSSGDDASSNVSGTGQFVRKEGMTFELLRGRSMFNGMG